MLNLTIKSSGVWALQVMVWVARAWDPRRVAPTAKREAKRFPDFMGHLLGL
jgi:hypothetical protein